MDISCRATFGALFVAVAVAIETPTRLCEHEVCSQTSILSSVYLRELCVFAASAGPLTIKSSRFCNSTAPSGALEISAIPAATRGSYSAVQTKNGSTEQPEKLRVTEPVIPVATRGSFSAVQIKNGSTEQLEKLRSSILKTNRGQLLSDMCRRYFNLPPDEKIKHMVLMPSHVWNKVCGVTRHAIHEHPGHLKGFGSFLASVELFDWVLFLTTGGVCLFLCTWILHLNHARALQQWGFHVHVAVLTIWILIGVAYNRLVWWRLGPEEGLAWTSGYLLEMIFSIENVFVFSSIIDAFKVPQKSSQKAIFVVICCQIVFQMVLIMGLASWLRSLQFLPYALGAWIIYVGWCVSQQYHEAQFDITESGPIRLFKYLFGDCFALTYDEAGRILVREPARGRIQLTLLAAAILSLVIADFCLEVDVTLSKVEEIPTQYISFTSSAIAAFMVPELYLVIKALATRYSQLRYGISFALIFFGGQMLLHHFIAIPDIVGCSIMIGAMCVSILYAEIEKVLRGNRNVLIVSEDATLEARPADSKSNATSETDSTEESWPKESAGNATLSKVSSAVTLHEAEQEQPPLETTPPLSVDSLLLCSGEEPPKGEVDIVDNASSA